MGNNPDRKLGKLPYRKGDVERIHRNGQIPTPRLPGKWLDEEPAYEFSSEVRPKDLRAATLIRAQQRLGGPLAAWMREQLRSVDDRPLMTMI